jgi:hypothetical protein
MLTAQHHPEIEMDFFAPLESYHPAQQDISILSRSWFSLHGE